MPIVPISETGEPVLPPDGEIDQNPEVLEKGKRSKTVMLYTSITFAVAILVSEKSEIL